jgi:hypothetical protein
VRRCPASCQSRTSALAVAPGGVGSSPLTGPGCLFGFRACPSAVCESHLAGATVPARPSACLCARLPLAQRRSRVRTRRAAVRRRAATTMSQQQSLLPRYPTHLSRRRP